MSKPEELIEEANRDSDELYEQYELYEETVSRPFIEKGIWPKDNKALDDWMRTKNKASVSQKKVDDYYFKLNTV